MNALPYAFGGTKYIDMAIKWAATNATIVSIYLRSVPGCQIGADHSGKSGEINLPKDPENIKLIVKVVGMISERGGKPSAVWGIKMLSEPIVYDHKLFTRFYHDGYAAIQQNLPTVHVVMNSFIGPHKWIWSVLPKPQY